MSKRTIQEKLNELKKYRKEIIDNSKSEGLMIYNKVEFLGEGENTGKELYRVIEEFSVEENKTEINQYFYEFENDIPKLIAIKNQNTFNEIVPVDYPGEEGPEKEKWDAELLDIEQCLEEKEKELKSIAKELGIDGKEINSLSEIDLEQKIEDKELENQEEKQQEQNKDESQQISEEEAEKVGIKGSGMNSVRMDTQIDAKGHTLGNELKLDEYDSLIVVHSYKLSQLQDSEGKKGNVNNINLALVGKKNDGTLEIIPETKLRQYRGSNTEVTEINNKDEIETKNENCIFEVPNSNKRIAIDQKDPYGIPEIYYGETNVQNSANVMQSVQDERDGTQKQDIEVRALFNSNKGKYEISEIQHKVDEHSKNGCDDFEIDEIDDNKNTGHIHYNTDSQEQQNAIEEIMEKGKVSKEYAEALFAKELEQLEDGEKSINEAKENAIEEINQQYMGGDSRKR